MRRTTLAAVLAAMIALAAGTAWADHGRGGRYGSWGYGYGPPPATRGWSYGYGPTNQWRSDNFGRAAFEVRQAHSRYRYYVHPQSNYNQPPRTYDYWGW